ncbi:MAG TPA: hypothetical protein DEH78_03535 [Solibacterales bacterium]|nr:hypothetical protein [Bryobacterales bacterium]
MSEHITHVAVFEDCCRLALHSGRLAGPFRTVLNKHWDFARFGSTSRSGDRFSIAILKYCRENWPDGGKNVEEKLAFVVAWRCHQAADRRFKPVYREVEPEHYAKPNADNEFGAPSESRVLHDVVVYREVYGSGQYPPFMRGLLDDRLHSLAGAQALDYDATFAALGGVWQRTLQQQHPERTAGGFVEATAKAPGRFQRYYVDVQRYAEMFANPDADFMRRFIVEPNFYDRRDPLIALARALQRKEPLPAVPFEKAYALAADQSQYAQSLRMGLRYVFAASDFFEGKISEAETNKLFDLDRNHLQGGSFK